MSVTLEKSSDYSRYGGHDGTTCYVKNSDGTIPEYELMTRRYINGGVILSTFQGYALRSNRPVALAMFLRGKL